MRRFPKRSSICFQDVNEEYGALSNMHSKFPFKLMGFDIQSSEALYQALKFPNNPKIQRDILNAESPFKSKKISRQYSGRKDWDDIKIDVMKFCIELKYAHNKKRLTPIYHKTKGSFIVEKSDTDMFWGAKENENYFVGNNMLGLLHMELRQKIFSKKEVQITPIKINNIHLLGEDITRSFV